MSKVQLLAPIITQRWSICPFLSCRYVFFPSAETLRTYTKGKSWWGREESCSDARLWHLWLLYVLLLYYSVSFYCCGK